MSLGDGPPTLSTDDLETILGAPEMLRARALRLQKLAHGNEAGGSLDRALALAQLATAYVELARAWEPKPEDYRIEIGDRPL